MNDDRMLLKRLRFIGAVFTIVILIFKESEITHYAFGVGVVLTLYFFFLNHNAKIEKKKNSNITFNIHILFINKQIKKCESNEDIELRIKELKDIQKYLENKRNFLIERIFIFLRYKQYSTTYDDLVSKINNYEYERDSVIRSNLYKRAIEGETANKSNYRNKHKKKTKKKRYIFAWDKNKAEKRLAIFAMELISEGWIYNDVDPWDIIRVHFYNGGNKRYKENILLKYFPEYKYKKTEYSNKKFFWIKWRRRTIQLSYILYWLEYNAYYTDGQLNAWACEHFLDQNGNKLTRGLLSDAKSKYPNQSVSSDSEHMKALFPLKLKVSEYEPFNDNLSKEYTKFKHAEFLNKYSYKNL